MEDAKSRMDSKHSPVIEVYDHDEFDIFTGNVTYATYGYYGDGSLHPIELAPPLPSKKCPGCGRKLCRLANRSTSSELAVVYYIDQVCKNCGYWEQWIDCSSASCFVKKFSVARLRKFSLSDKELPYRSMIRWLEKHPSDVYYINPLRFEEVVRGALSTAMDVELAMTVASRDGGYDLFAYDSQGGKIIVEVKRYARHRKIGVRFVRHLAGVVLREGAYKGILVSTSDFTKFAIQEAEAFRRKIREHPIEIEFKSFQELLPWLAVERVRLDSELENEQYWEAKFEKLGSVWLPL